MSREKKQSPAARVTELAYWSCFFLLALLVFYRAPLTESFWLDEGITFWIVKDSLKDSFFRAYHFQGQSPLYYSLLWFWVKSLGSSELTLRLPSLFAGLVTIFCLYKFTVYLSASRLAGITATLLLLASDGFLQAVLSARPYSFALATSLVSICAFVMYLDRRDDRFLWWSCAFLIVTYYFHYLFVLCTVVHVLFYLERRTVEARYVFRAFIYVGICLLPGLFQLRKLASRAPDLSFAAPLTPESFLFHILPVPYLVYVLFSLLLVWIFVNLRPLKSELPRLQVLSCLLLWFLLPPILFALQAMISDTSLFVARYFLWTVPSICMLGAFILTAFHSERALRFVILFLFVFVALREVDRKWQIEDWRNASLALEAKASDSQLTLVYSGLIESDISHLNSAPEFLEYLLSPLRPYNDKPAMPLPSNLNRDSGSTFALRIGLTAQKFEQFGYIANVKTLVTEGDQERKVHEGHLEWFRARGFKNDLLFESPGVVAYWLIRSAQNSQAD